jgi:hypothetical protein
LDAEFGRALHDRVISLLDHAQLHQYGLGPPCTRRSAAKSQAGQAVSSIRRSHTSSTNRDTRPTPHKLSYNFLYGVRRYVVAGAAGSTALRSHFGASLEDHGPNVVL